MAAKHKHVEANIMERVSELYRQEVAYKVTNEWASNDNL